MTAFITKLLAAGLLTWLGLLAMLVAVRVLRGDIRVSGFLAESDGAQVTPERALMMIVFPLVLLMYVLRALNGDLAIVDGRPIMPDVPEFLLAVLTGGNGLYLAGKIARRA